MSDITVNGVTYRQLFNTCGGRKKDCKKCARGEGHGPYWYAFGNGHSRKYIGKDLPEEITKHQDLLESEKGNLEALRTEISERSAYHRKEERRAEDELRAVSALMRGEYVDQRILKSLQLEKFSVNGHK